MYFLAEGEKTICLVLLAPGKSNSVAARYEADNGVLCAEDTNSRSNIEIEHKSTFWPSLTLIPGHMKMKR
jgi:hypothetical protein